MSLPICRLGQIGRLRSILDFHALAELGWEGIVIVEPSDWYVSVGYFDDAATVLDVAACRELSLPIVRREIGGGPVLLGPGQVFYVVILGRSHPQLPHRLEDAYRYFSRVPIEAYARLGVAVSYRPVNDLVTADGKKISGQGAADIAERFVFVGNIMNVFDTRTMSRVLKVQEEKFRDKIWQTMESNLTWIEREVSAAAPHQVIADALEASFEALVGPLRPVALPPEAEALAERLEKKFTAPDYVFRESPRKHETVKIREGVELRHGVHKATGGLIRAEVDVEEGRITALSLTGDFTFIPKAGLAALSRSLLGVAFEKGQVARAIGSFLSQNQAQCPGVTADDFATAITGS